MTSLSASSVSENPTSPVVVSHAVNAMAAMAITATFFKFML